MKRGLPFASLGKGVVDFVGVLPATRLGNTGGKGSPGVSVGGEVVDFVLSQAATGVSRVGIVLPFASLGE